MILNEVMDSRAVYNSLKAFPELDLSPKLQKHKTKWLFGMVKDQLIINFKIITFRFQNDFLIKLCNLFHIIKMLKFICFFNIQYQVLSLMLKLLQSIRNQCTKLTQRESGRVVPFNDYD